jgi:hypothetical protein
MTPTTPTSGGRGIAMDMMCLNSFLGITSMEHLRGYKHARQNWRNTPQLHMANVSFYPINNDLCTHSKKTKEKKHRE